MFEGKQVGGLAFCDAPGFDAFGTYAHGLAMPVDFHMDRLNIGQLPHPVLVVGMRNRVSSLWALAAYFALPGHF